MKKLGKRNKPLLRRSGPFMTRKSLQRMRPRPDFPFTQHQELAPIRLRYISALPRFSVEPPGAVQSKSMARFLQHGDMENPASLDAEKHGLQLGRAGLSPAFLPNSSLCTRFVFFLVEASQPLEEFRDRRPTECPERGPTDWLYAIRRRLPANPGLAIRGRDSGFGVWGRQNPDLRGGFLCATSSCDGALGCWPASGTAGGDDDVRR
ncbi:hypothetical protein VTI74DRAFT_423 [Chaetomium olivicolor]